MQDIPGENRRALIEGREYKPIAVNENSTDDRCKLFFSDVLMQLRQKRSVSRALEISLEESMRDAFALALTVGEMNSLFAAIRKNTEEWVAVSFVRYLELNSAQN